jgi:hypothetical protein
MLAIAGQIFKISKATLRNRFESLSRRCHKANHSDIEATDLKGFIQDPFRDHFDIERVENGPADLVKSLKFVASAQPFIGGLKLATFNWIELTHRGSLNLSLAVGPKSRFAGDDIDRR